MTLDMENWPLSILTGVCIKQANFSKIMSFSSGQTKLSFINRCPY